MSCALYFFRLSWRKKSEKIIKSGDREPDKFKAKYVWKIFVNFSKITKNSVMRTFIFAGCHEEKKLKKLMIPESGNQIISKIFCSFKRFPRKRVPCIWIFRLSWGQIQNFDPGVREPDKFPASFDPWSFSLECFGLWCFESFGLGPLLINPLLLGPLVLWSWVLWSFGPWIFNPCSFCFFRSLILGS